MNTGNSLHKGMNSAELEKLLKLAQARGIGKADQRPATIPIIPRDGALPLSLSQRGLWLVSQNEKASVVYHIPVALRLVGALDRDALRRSLDALLARHDALRTVFDTVDGEPQARLLPANTAMPMVEHDLREQDDAQGTLARLGEQAAVEAFDLVNGPLIRCRLVRMGEHEHVLLLTQHHIVFDGGSATIFARELHTLYTAFAQGRENPLPSLAVQYPDYAAWQHSWLSGERLQRQSQYWRSMLADAPVLLELPTDRPRPALQDFTGAEVAITLNAGLTQALKRLSQAHGATLFMTLLAGWSVTLSRLSGQDDMVIGIPTANRGIPELEGVIGLFVSTLALRVSLAGVGDVRDLIARVRGVVAGAQEHRDLPFYQVVDIVQPPRRRDHSPVFQVLCNWDDASDGPAPAGAIEVAPLSFDYKVSRHDLKLNFHEYDGCVHATFMYATALFDAATIERHAAYLVNVLEAMVADAHRQVADIVLLPADERRLLVEDWNATTVAYPHERCVQHLFEDQVRSTPTALALVHGERSMDYAELNAQANRLAHCLIQRGIQPGKRVAICVERSMAMVVGMLAILKAGAAYVPLDPAYSPQRLAEVLADAAPLLVLHDACGRGALGEAALAGRACLDLEPLNAADTGQVSWSMLAADNPVVSGLTSAYLAYVIYTSGSTGTPKGVMVEHRSLVNFQRAMQRHIYREGTVMRIGWNASFSFDMSMKGFLQLLAGHTLVIIPQDVRASPADFLKLLEEQAIDGFDVTPSQLRALLAEGLLEQTRRRTVLIGGEAIDATLWQQLRGASAIEFHNMYGPTECTVDATMSVIGAGDTAPHIGRALDNMRIYLLDAARRLVPRGSVGEVYIGGAGVARGYLNRPELTAERFLPDPLVASARMYRTGDLARYLPDGRLVYLGRNDRQVKVRGFRVELGEIEARLTALALVSEAVVLARDASEGGAEQRLVAYVVPQDADLDSAALVTTLRTELAAQLPDYMLPSAFVRLAELPLTSNGKLDRKALPAPDDEAYASRAYVAPQGALEQAMAGLWQALLETQQVGREDDFFELGGHSLLAVRLMVHIRQTFGAELPVVTLFANPTLAALSRAVAEAGGDLAAPVESSSIPALPRDGRLPLSFAQQRLWFLSQWEGVSVIYHVPTALRMRGTIDCAALRRSLDALMARHEALRSVFELVDGEPVVRLLPAATALPLIEHDLSGTPDAPMHLEQLAKVEARTPFDLRHGPLIRARLVRMASDNHVLLLTLHHIISDRWSSGIMSRELGVFYQAFVQGATATLPALGIQYPDYAAWQRDWLSGERLQRQTDYWRSALAGAPALLELPTDRPRPAQQDFAAAQVPVLLDTQLTGAVKRLSQRHGTTMFMTLLAAWSLVLSRLAGQNDVVVGTPTANRGHAQTEGLIGFFINTLALRVNLDELPDTRELLARTRTASLAAQDHQDLPFEQVVELLQPKRRLDHTPIFQVLLNWHNNDPGLPDFPDVHVDVLDVGVQSVKFDLELNLTESDEQITGELSYATALFDASTMERHVGYLESALRAMVRDDERPLTAADILGDQERALLQSWNDTRTPYRQDCCAHRLFEEQAQRTPAAAAVRFEGLTLSYGELNAQANRLAHHLIGLGVRPGERVAICVERGAAMVVGVLAIVKAGGAYVPLDPAYPSERLGQVLIDAAPVVVLSDAAGRQALGAAATGSWTMGDLEPLGAGNDRTALWSERAATDPQVAGLTPDHPAYVIYTSGSTGKPKGVVGLHKPLINLIDWVNQRFGVGPDDVILLTSSLSFDLSVYDIFGLLAAGGCIHVAARADLADPQRLARLLFTEKLTFWDSAPAVFQQLLFYFDEASKLGNSQLRLAFFSGDWIPLDFFPAIERTFPGCDMIALGGATEAAVWSNFYPVKHIDPRWASIPYGRPIQNARYYVLDAHLNALPVGSRGDLYIGGECLTAGYFGRPDLTAERFVTDPFAAGPQARMYKTGDQARYYADGNLEFLGRTDFQVKIRGFRIELGEVEARLADSPMVRDSVVVARADSTGEKRLLAYVVPAGAATGAAELAGALRAFMAARLPDYMVPSAFVRMDAFPLTPNGKLDRDQLPAPDGDAYAQRSYAAPEGDVEQTIARVWQELLEVERVGRDDNFFELGGHSLLAVRLVERLRHENLHMDVRSLFVAPVLRDFAVKTNELEEIRL